MNAFLAVRCLNLFPQLFLFVGRANLPYGVLSCLELTPSGGGRFKFSIPHGGMSWAHATKAFPLRPKSCLQLRPFTPLLYRPQSLHLHLRCVDSVDIFMPLLFITLEE